MSGNTEPRSTVDCGVRSASLYTRSPVRTPARRGRMFGSIDFMYCGGVVCVQPTSYPQSFSQLFLGTGGGGKPRPHTCARLPIAASTLGLHNISVISVQGRRVSVSASTAHAESLGGSWGQIKMRHQHSQGAQREGGTGRARERYRRFVLHWPLSWRSSLNGSKGKAPRRHKIKF